MNKATVMEETPQPAEPKKQVYSRSQIKEAINMMAYIIGKTRSEMIDNLKEDIEGEDLKFAVSEIDKILKGCTKLDRKTVRFNRKKNGLTFSKIVKSQLQKPKS
jgi:hypothetical protein